MPKLTIDGKEIQARDGQSVIEAAHENGISIGHYCWHPGLSPEGNCRMCLVEVEKAPKLMPSCMTTVAEGMVVRTEHVSEKVQAAQRDVMEFLLVDHPIDCPICDQAGECKLQDYYMKYDRQPSRVPLESKLKMPKRVRFSDQVVYDTERCIHCTRCVRFCREVAGQEELGMFNRGATSYIGLQEGDTLSNPYQVNVVDICPVGALTHTEFRFQKRVWFMKSAKSVCAGCSRGCNIDVDYENLKVYRYRPRQNPEVNKWWMCDYGRLTFKNVHAEGRALTPRLRRGGEESERSDWLRAINRTVDVFALLTKKDGNQAVAAVGSPLASVEENYLLKKLFAERFPGAEAAFPPEDLYADGKADKVLKTADLSPNARAGKALGFQATLAGVLANIESGKTKGLYLLSDDFLEKHLKNPELAESFEKAVSKLSWLVVQSPYMHRTARAAHALFASSHHVESEGTFINVDGRVQRFAQAIRPPAEARMGTEILNEVGLKLGVKLPGGGRIRDVFNALAAELPAFSGLTWEKLGEAGALLPS